jgi:AAA+ ATPase superfamily predicted ATPase
MKSRFVGRDSEIKELEGFLRAMKSSLIICRGRRRIGKSTLIQQIGNKANHFIEIQGLSPRENITLKDQLESFSQQFSKQTGFPALRLENWEQAFSLLNRAIQKTSTVVFLDEISWMAQGDKDFAGKLKIAWDTELKHHNKLTLVLCGSVSSWMEENILNNTGFAGRVSLDIKLEELDLEYCVQFWGKNHSSISTMEKLKLLSVTGGVPRYLEEIRPDLSAEQNIFKMCFKREGFLFSEFEHIFTSIFSRRAETYKKILSALVGGTKTIDEICQHIGIEKSGTMTNYLSDLSEAGFIHKDVSFNFKTYKPSKSSRYRLKDNYTRFYLRYIQEKKPLIESSILEDTNLESFIEWNIISGLQFENLVLNNLKKLIEIMGISSGSIQFASPYFQSKTLTKEPCQIDLLIITKHSIYIVEMKFRKKVSKQVIPDMIEKSGKLSIPKHLSVRPVLVYSGDIDPVVESEDYFFRTIHMEEFFRGG